MFCARCGTQLQPDTVACFKCGRRIGDPVSAIAQSRLERQLDTLGTLWVVIGGLFKIPFAILILLGTSTHLILGGREPFGAFGPFILYIGAGTLMIMAAGGVCVGLGLMQRRAWDRAAAIILGVLAIFHPPSAPPWGFISCGCSWPMNTGTNTAFCPARFRLGNPLKFLLFREAEGLRCGEKIHNLIVWTTCPEPSLG